MTGEYYPEDHMKVEVTLPVSWNTKSLEDQVAGKIVRKISKGVTEHAYKVAIPAVNDAVNEAIVEVMERKIQRRDAWGKCIGDEVAVQDLLKREAKDWLIERVDQYGCPSRSSRATTRAQYLFRKEIGDSLTGTVKAIIRENVGDIEQLVAKEVRRQIKKLA